MVMDAVEHLKMDVQSHSFGRDIVYASGDRRCYNCGIPEEEVDPNNAVCIHNREKAYNAGPSFWLKGIGRVCFPV